MVTETDAMDSIASSPLGTDESSWSGSTGPTTPASSPLFGPSKGDDLTLSHYLHSSLDSDILANCGPVRNVCVVGAGYVGKLVRVPSENDVAFANYGNIEKEDQLPPSWPCITHPSPSRSWTGILAACRNGNHHTSPSTSRVSSTWSG